MNAEPLRTVSVATLASVRCTSDRLAVVGDLVLRRLVLSAGESYYVLTRNGAGHTHGNPAGETVWLVVD